MPIARFCEFARDCGADGIEVLDAFWYAPGAVRDHLVDTSAFETELGESLGSLNLHAVAVTNDFALGDPARVTIERSKIEAGVAIAQRFGSGLVRVFSGHPSPDQVDEARQRAIEELQRINAPGRVLALENHGVPFGTPEEVLTISRGAGTGICFDIGNWLLAGVDPVRAAQELPFPDIIHVKDFSWNQDGAYQTPDGDKLSGAFLGDGIVPIKETLEALLTRPDRRPIPIDLELECGEQGKEATQQGVKWLRSLLAQLGSSI